MKKILLSLLAVSLFLGLHGKETVLIENGKSSCKIVLPEQTAPSTLKQLKKSALEFAKIIEESTGARLPVISEKDHTSGTPAIYLGNTRYARSIGIDTEKMPAWESIIRMEKQNLVLAGKDVPAEKKGSPYFTAHTLGTVRAMADFLQTFLGVKFLIPGKNGTVVPKKKKVAIPQKSLRITRPRFSYCRTRPFTPFYHAGNDILRNTDTWLYGGHTYVEAVPVRKFWKKHPEYYRLVGGGRSDNGNHLCISNPAVQDLIFKELLKRLDSGYETVELGQTDDYHKCECANCRNFMGVSDPGEQLWLFHRALAQRVLKARPQKKVMILAYQATADPPKTFREFPANCAIELCRNDEATLEKWSKVKIPHGLTIYLYNWGFYHTQGFTPKRSFAYLKEQMKRLQKYNVKAVYQCGFGELFGLEGPQYYCFSRLAKDPDSNPALVLREYVEAAFGPAANNMQEFYETIDERLAGAPLNSEALKHSALKPEELLPALFPPRILARLERILTAAEKKVVSSGDKARLALVRTELDYMASSVRALCLYNAYRLSPDWQRFSALEKEVLKRRQIIDRLFPKSSSAVGRTLPGWGFPMFNRATRAEVRQNGRLLGMVGAPFDWNFDLLRSKKYLPCSTIPRYKVRRVKSVPDGLDFDSGVWRSAPWLELDGIQLAPPSVPTRIKILFDGKTLHFAWEGKVKRTLSYNSLGKDSSCWGQDCMEIILDPFGTREKHYHFIFNAVPDSCYDARLGFSTDPLDPYRHRPDRTWNGKWSYNGKISKNLWKVHVKIPAANFPVQPPVPGTVWNANFGREELILPQGRKQKMELLLWSPNPEAENFHDREKFGELVFE